MRRFSRDNQNSNFSSEYSMIHSHFITQSRHFDSILSELNQFDDQNKQSVTEMKKYIRIILSSNYGNIIDNCKQTISAVQNIISKENIGDIDENAPRTNPIKARAAIPAQIENFVTTLRHQKTVAATANEKHVFFRESLKKRNKNSERNGPTIAVKEETPL